MTKCKKRLPDMMIGEYKASLLCDLPLNHDGPCKPDDVEIRVLNIALPEVEDRLYPEIG